MSWVYSTYRDDRGNFLVVHGEERVFGPKKIFICVFHFTRNSHFCLKSTLISISHEYTQMEFENHRGVHITNCMKSKRQGPHLMPLLENIAKNVLQNRRLEAFKSIFPLLLHVRRKYGKDICQLISKYGEMTSFDLAWEYI